MKNIGNRPIAEADTIFFPYLLLEESYALSIAVSGQICLKAVFISNTSKFLIKSA